MNKLKGDYTDFKTQYFSLGDILAIGLMIATGLYFIISSALKIADLFFGTMNSYNLLLNIMGASAGYILIFGAYRFVTKSNFLKSIADDLFVEALYDRLEPLLADIADNKASYDVLSERLEDLNYNVNDIRKSIDSGRNQKENDLVPLQYALRDISHQFHYIMLTMVTLSLYVFMVNNPGGILPYLSPIVFVLWWAVITSHSNLWDLQKAWYWVAIPILMVPMFSILFAALTTGNTMLLVMYFGLSIYAISYYVWCERTTRGITPFGIGERIRNLKNMLKSEAQEEKKETEEKEIIFYPYYIGIILTIFSIIVFSISVIGYLIQSKIMDITWQELGFDVTWQPLYSYGLIALGTALLITGYFFMVRFRRRE